MRSALVVGATGFLGRHLVAALANEGWRVVGAGRHEAPSGWQHDWVTCDLRSGQSVADAVGSVVPDVVFHVAGAPKNDLDELLAVQVAGTQRLLEAAAAADPSARVVVAGSAAEYGHVPAEDLPVTEAIPLRPASLYGVAKAGQSLLALRPGTGAIVARVFNISGPGEPPGLVAGAFAEQIVELERAGRSGTIAVGDLTAERDFVDVRDAATALAALGAQGRLGEAYNVCSGVATAISDLFQLLAEDARVKVEAQHDTARAAAVNVPRIVGSAAKLTAATGWKPQIRLSETLSDTLASYRAERSDLP